MSRFRRQAVQVDAHRYTGWGRLMGWLKELGLEGEDGDGSDGSPGMWMEDEERQRLVIDTPEGEMSALPGDWILRDVKSGDFFPCKDAVFTDVYEEVGPELVLAMVATGLLEKSVEDTPTGPVIDLDVFGRLLFAHELPARLMNRDKLTAELEAVREEMHGQGVKVNNDDLPEAVRQEAAGRLLALQRREKQILDTLWPIS